ncbi:hypothetical protein [Xanthomonas phage Xp15]|uniref:Uncharacterized protein n=1 Tax=Xanthomonas phage Xp15 TaxID=322855 RepID=Q52PT2_9CAUD|nr:hypothetical protein XPXV15_gp79 [Xanthomonas phage Xp15]AAX84928.1 hypothetical protein [Xanthomonas phage Xp15]
MGRLSFAVLDKYEYLPSKQEGTCYFCGAGGRLSNDLTPANTATVSAQAMFMDKWVYVKACQKCWHKIYTANTFNQGKNYKVLSGCMTLDMKFHLLGIGNLPDNKRSNGIGWVKEGTRLIPLCLAPTDQDDYFWDQYRITGEEIQALQGTLATLYMGLPRLTVNRTFDAALASGDLELDRIDLYRGMMGMNDLEDRLEAKSPNYEENKDKLPW